MSAEKKKYNLVTVILRIIPIQFKSAPWNCLIENTLGIMNGLSFTLAVVATQRLFDVISKAAAGKAGFLDCVIPLLLLAAVTFGQQIINGVQNFHGIGILLPKSSGRLTALIHKKLRRIDPVYFEDTDFLDDLNKAREGIRAITMFCMIVFVCVSFYGVYFRSIPVPAETHADHNAASSIYPCSVGTGRECTGIYQAGRTERSAQAGI